MTELDKDNIYYVSSIGYDQYNAGLEIGKYVAEHYGDKDVKLAILEGYAGIVNTMRIDGFKEGIQGRDNIQIVASQTADWTREYGFLHQTFHGRKLGPGAERNRPHAL